MTQNPLIELARLGQSVWMDFIDRGTISSGKLRRYIENDGLRGMTSNPAIFEKAIAGGREYDAPIRSLARANKSAIEIYEALTVEDIQLAADAFRPVFDRLGGGDGFVSLEVSPHLAHDSSSTIAEAQRLWAAVNRPNVMIKVPATAEGLFAIQELVSQGINVNVTLLFGLKRYEEVAEAYLAGLESRADRAKSVRVDSVASFFLSRIDVLVDAEIERRERGGQLRSELASALRGQVAIACARIAYQKYKQIFGRDRFRSLAQAGARPQRLLWASTGTKNPADSDVKYVEPLIGPETINTMPLKTFEAYRDHGRPAIRLEEHLAEARAVLDELGYAGIDLDEVTQRLEDEGVRKFIEPYDRLLDIIAKRRLAALSDTAEIAAPRGPG